MKAWICQGKQEDSGVGAVYAEEFKRIGKRLFAEHDCRVLALIRHFR